MRLNVLVGAFALAVSSVAFADTSMMNSDRATVEGAKMSGGSSSSGKSDRQSAGTDRQRSGGTLHTDFPGTLTHRDRLHRY